MRYIGNKENIIDKINHILKSQGVVGNRFFDFFTGTTSVARYYKKLGYCIESSDIMYMSFCLQKAYIENNIAPDFKQLLPIIESNTYHLLFATPLEKVVDYLNNIEPQKGFIYSNYTPEGTKELPKPRMYFSDENGQIIDAIRQQIELWKQSNLLLESEYFILLSCLIETVSFYANVAGVYAAFQKQWDPRATKRLLLRTIPMFDNGLNNIVHNTDSMMLIPNIDTDILYLDPPYNERQYLPNYHILETISRYDNPTIHGITGMRKYEEEKSGFCNAKTALDDLNKVAKAAKYQYLVLSYNSEGIMSQNDIIDTLSQYGSVKLEMFEYLRFKSNNNGLAQSKKRLFEQLYILKR